MDDDWDDLRPDSGDFGISLKDALVDVAVFAARIFAVVLIAALVIGSVVYAVWREALVIRFLMG